MKRTQLLQESRKMHFEEIMSIKNEKCLTYSDAAQAISRLCQVVRMISPAPVINFLNRQTSRSIIRYMIVTRQE